MASIIIINEQEWNNSNKSVQEKKITRKTSYKKNTSKKNIKKGDQEGRFSLPGSVVKGEGHLPGTSLYL